MLPDHREWNEQLLKECMYPHDVNEVLKIRLSERIQDDHIERFYERSGILTVGSAYKLAVEAERDEESRAGSGARTDRSRLLYGEIWSANVPSKVRIFAWRLLRDGLATQVNWKMRTLEKDAICQVCGREDESSHHAMIRCSKAAALRHEMRKHWTLPGEHQFQKVGPD
jgi:hypothetical protein